MESDDDFELLPSSPVREPQLRRLKKAIKISKPSNDHVSTPPEHSSDFGTVDFGESNVAELKNLSDDNALNTKPDDSGSIEKGVSGAMRVLEFDSLVKECEGKEVDEFDGQGQAACSTEIEKRKEVRELKTEKLEKKRPSPNSFSGKKEKKKKKIDSDGGNEKLEESASNKRKAEKERLNYLKELRAESQRLLRESRDAAFKPIPTVQKPISSVLDKIRQRKLEVLKKCNASIDDDGGMTRQDKVDDNPELPCHDNDIIGKVGKNGHEDTFHSHAETNNLDESHFGEPNGAVAPNNSSPENNSPSLDIGLESDTAFRAPIDDTQELFSDSQRSKSSDTNDETQIMNADSPSNEVFAPSRLAMDLKLDSAPPDDVSSDEDDNDKENVDPHLHGFDRSADSSLPASGDPVKAFVDEEAEEEDDSDNDLERFQDNEEDEDADVDDIDELKNMIATQYEERPVDRERRDQLHQQWLEQQDAAGMDNLLQKLNCGSKLRKETSFDEEEYEEGHETYYESDEEDKDVAPSDAERINLKKVKQMIPQMFTDKDEAYLSSDEDETEERLAKQCLYDKTEEQATFLSPAEDESSREVFSRIKKLNIMPDTKRKGKTPSFMDTLLIGPNINTSSKSSFLGRASNHSMPSSQRHGLSKVRSFIFGRDDSNSRSSISMSEDSLDMIQTENQTQRTVSAKFKSFTQHKYSTSNSASHKSGTSLLEILRRSSMHAEQSVQNTVVQQSESVFAAFKLAKKPTKTEGRV